MTRLKVTAYLRAEDLEDDGYLDASDKTGLSESGYSEVMNYTLTDFEDVETELVEED